MTVQNFVHELAWEGLPEAVQRQARRCLLDTVGSAVGGRRMELSRVVHDFAALAYGGTGAQLWLDGRTVSPPGAALANGMTTDALDIHDGYRFVKGHAGAALVPAGVATLSLAEETVAGRELLASLAMGYEIALRAGLALHGTACDYHTSGAWNALGCAAITARRLGLSPEQTRHALGIAEYHGPRSPMMRDVDHPTMVKDGSGWGAMVGVSAALMAQGGFTGAPAATVEGTDVAGVWADLGERWLMLEQYFKPYGVCRWAQPAIHAALALQAEYDIDPAGIARIEVFTFHEAVRLAVTRPGNTEEAQYSLPFPVAAALVHGRLGPDELSDAALQDETVLALADKIEVTEDAALSERFPGERLCRVRITTADGDTVASGETHAPWGPDDPPSDDDLLEKFRWLAGGSMAPGRASALEEMLWHCDQLDDARDIAMTLAAPSAKVEPK